MFLRLEQFDGCTSGVCIFIVMYYVLLRPVNTYRWADDSIFRKSMISRKLGFEGIIEQNMYMYNLLIVLDMNKLLLKFAL